MRSRRGWDMTEHVAFLAELPVRAILDGELVALGDNGKPDFPHLCECVIERSYSIPLTDMVVDVLRTAVSSLLLAPLRRNDGGQPAG